MEVLKVQVALLTSLSSIAAIPLCLFVTLSNINLDSVTYKWTNEQYQMEHKIVICWYQP